MSGDKEKVKKRKDDAGGHAGTVEFDEEVAPRKKKRQAEDHHDDWQDAETKAFGGRGGGKGGRGGGNQGRGRGGRVGGHVEDSSRPSAMKMLKPKAGRSHTLSVALPASIIENAQSWELRAMLVGQIARTLTIFAVDEVILYDDWSEAPQSDDIDGVSRAMAFFVRNLQYLETPQYLRRQLIPMHRDLKWVGLLSPLDAPHHLRKNEKLAYREGVVLPKEKWRKKPPGESEGCWANCGLQEPVWLEGEEIPPDMRVTVRMERRRNSDADNEDQHQQRGVAVPPREPTTKLGLYWGFQVRIAKSLKAVFDESPYEDGGYDMTFGTSERGEALGVSRVPKFRHLLLVFGGVGGLEEAISDVSSGYPANTDPATLFTRYLNICPNQASRTIRTEEALVITLSVLNPYLPER